MTTRRRTSPIPAHMLVPGYFTAPVRAWFGADWQPRTQWGVDQVSVSEVATRARNKRLERVETDSIVGLSRRSDALLATATIERARRRGR